MDRKGADLKGAGLEGGFNGATSFQKWIEAFSHPLPHFAYICFNGATSFQKWIGLTILFFPMLEMAGFNGATSFQKWIEAFSHPLPHFAYICFNGATSFQKWIAVSAVIDIESKNVFQWSHFISEMDSEIDRWARCPRNVVSMEPLLFRNG